ncbi:leucine-rich repeat domain-containing protein [Romboutsia sp.]|uniref:leucine-rich repeat domain-containing protein n=1 Tax=Romboutsia sp. TaxID=1965302 RepID=UPI003F35F684
MVKIANFEKSNSNQHNTEKYILYQKNYVLSFFSNQLKLSYRNNIKPQSNKLKNFIKSIFSTEATNSAPVSESTFLVLKFNNFNEESTIEYKNDKNITYTSIYTNIDLSYYLKDEKIECVFILKDDCNPKDINISVDENSVVTFDENKNLLIKVDSFNILMSKAIYKGKDIYFTLENGLIILNFEDEYSTLEENIDSEENFMNIEEVNILKEFNDDSLLFIKSIPPSSEIYSEEIRTLLIPVKKSKFSYPYSKSTSLLCYPNLPIIESLFTSTEIRQNSFPIQGICPEKSVNIFINYKDVALTPCISYSVALFSLQFDYNNNPIQDISTINNPYQISQIENVDIYGFENDSFEGITFNLCQNINNIPFRAVDFLIDLEILTGVTYSGLFFPIIRPIREVEDYYLYEIEIKINVYKAPPIQPSDIQTQEALNIALGRPSGSTEPFTPGELESITNLNLANNSNLDPSLLKYTPNLIYLDISNCDLDNIDTAYLQTLQSLEFLDISSNGVSSLEMIKDIKTLKILNISGCDITDLSALENLIGLTILNASSTPSVITTDIGALNVILGNKIIDTTPLANLTNLESLNLAGNLIEDIAPLASLVNLLKLDVSENAINDLSPLITLPNLSELYAQGQVIYLPPIYPIVDNDFILDLSFLKDIDSITPCIDYISNDGNCSGEDSCDCLSIIWKYITEDTYAQIQFSHDIISSDISNFSGTINILLKQPLP